MNKLILMIGNNCLLDTNIISAWLGNDYAIADRIDKAASIYMCVIVVGEMYFGARYSAKVKYNIRNISKALAQYSLLTIDEVSRNAGSISHIQLSWTKSVNL